MPKTVLIVDNDNFSGKLVADVLMSQNYRTLRTRDGHLVLDIARRHRPNLIVMDVKLPGISGMDVARMLKGDPELRGIPIIAVTASAQKEDKERILAGGFDGYVFKPISVANFLHSVNQTLAPLNAAAVSRRRPLSN